jgi:DinB superfamily
MSVLSAIGPRSPAEAKSYAAALLDLLGTQNPLQVLRETADLLHEDLRRIPRPHLDTPEAPGKWSARMVIAHLADVELVGAYHLRLVLAHDRPPLAPLDQDAWAERLHYDKADLQASIDRFTVLRKANLAIVQDASPADLMRVGLHAERGEESLDQMRRLAAGHDLAHLRQLARLRILTTGQ